MQRFLRSSLAAWSRQLRSLYLLNPTRYQSHYNRSTRSITVTASIQSHSNHHRPHHLVNSIHRNSKRPFSGDSVNDDLQRIRREVIDILRTVDHPANPNQDIVYLGLIRNLKISESPRIPNGYVISIDLELDRFYRDLKRMITDSLMTPQQNNKNNKIAPSFSIDSVRINMAPKPGTGSTADDVLKNVKHIVAVSSCKGGVGKSSIAVNLAFTLSKMDYFVGIFDADIYGPSLPTMTAANTEDANLRQNQETQLIYPVLYEGVKLMSFGFVKTTETETGLAAMRGPMVSNVIQQLLFQTNWAGTSDIHLTLTQKLKISGSVVVTTPQLLSQIDVVKGIEMWKKVNVPICGLIENMTYYQCSECGAKQNVFNHHRNDNGFDFKRDFGIKQIYEIPIYPLISRFSDYGDPIVLNDDGFIGAIFEDIASGVVRELEGKEEGEHYRWDIDDERRVITFRGNTLKDREVEMGFVALRLQCKCALCKDEMTNQQLVRMEDIDPNIGIEHVEECGNYGVRIIWSDKHESIYSVDELQRE